MTEPNHPPGTHISADEGDSNDGPEISLLDIVNFLQGAWKKLAIASIVGAVLGLFGWFFLSSYQAQLVLNNKGGVDLVSWLNLQKSLPNLAVQMQAKNLVPEEEQAIYRQMSDEAWWKKNGIPNFSVTKSDLKEMSSQTIADGGANNTILSLRITAGGRSEGLALANVNSAGDFVKKGASYLTIKSWLSGLQLEAKIADAEVARQISATNVELQYQKIRLSNLEVQLRRFPSDPKGLPQLQVVDPKDLRAKYLPLTTQIIGLNTDIATNQETLARLTDRLAQNGVLKLFLESATPLMSSTVDGAVLAAKLLELESGLRAKFGAGDLRVVSYLDNLRATLLATQNQYSARLEQNAPATATKQGMLKPAAGGLVGAFFLMLLVLLGQRVWASVKGGGAKWCVWKAAASRTEHKDVRGIVH